MTVLSDVRAKLAKINASELAVIDNQPALLEMWNKMQELRQEMNEAKKFAASEAAKPYLETIDKLEKQYAVLLRLSA